MTATSRTVTFVGVKGGVGTSTIAALHALQIARSDQPVRLTATDAGGVDDLAALLGTPTPAPGNIAAVIPGLTLADHPATTYNVVDGGTDCFSDHEGPVFVVLRNDYLSLRRALAVPQTTSGVILVTEPDRSLNRSDVSAVLSQPIVAEVPVDASVARAVDAGLLSTGRHLRIRLTLPTDPTPPSPQQITDDHDTGYHDCQPHDASWLCWPERGGVHGGP